MKEAKLILVTGGAGFIGSRLSARLARDGHRVIALDNYFAGSREPRVPGVDYREGHTRDIARLVPETPARIYHLGEYARPERSLAEPAVVFDLNLAGTAGVVEFWRQKNGVAACKLVYAGSSTKFADGGDGRNQSPYAWTKAANTELVANYARWYDLPYAIAYFYNVYGPGERAGAYGTVIEIFRQKRLAREPLVVNAPGTQTRNFTHVDDIIDGLLLVGERGEGDGYGIGDERAYSVREVAELFGGAVVLGAHSPANRQMSAIDTAKTRALGWVPRRDLATYITESLARLPA
ncbi:MAG: NAD-dependent epimerase/dehydratase family protein [Patescibacteria group bacterium]|nr:NAD-dependent epimerase/dehydratase family protein [Patescibacteria group bacterium]MDE1944447.1 NAD-dependent epimerase/dehydratase family protein [Patescibacteria group bacterium]MDE2057835.1 NAD-dependent epimerase/dehydratase family protein [Patescibacteria group bacterium]